MTRFALVVDMPKCSGCYACFMACRDEHCGNDHLPIAAAQPYEGHFWMRIIERERGSYPKVKTSYFRVPCMHCDDAPCVTRNPGMVYKRPDGIVIIDPVKAKGHEEILDSCPYRVIFWNEASALPQKCTMCAHLLDQGWEEPRCVEACPTKALLFGDLDDPESEVSRALAQGGAEVLHPEYGLEGNVWYVNMPKRFIAGSVIFGDTDKCAAGVTVTLRGEGVSLHTVTNGFGDFEFEGLEKNREYVLEFDHPGYLAHQLRASTQIDNYLGDVSLKRS